MLNTEASSQASPAPMNEDGSSSDGSSENSDRDNGLNEATDPISHMNQAEQCGSFCKIPQQLLTPKQRQLIQDIADNPLSCYRKAMDELAKWRGVKEELRSFNENFQAGLSVESRGTLGRLDPFIIEDMIQASNFVDKKYVHDLLVGFPVTGEVSCSGTGVEILGGRLVHGRPGS